MSSIRRLYFTIILIGTSLAIGGGLYRSFLSIMATQLDPTPNQSLVWFVTSAWFLLRIFLELPFGLTANRYGRRNFMVLGLILSTIGTFFCALSNTIYLLILGRVIWGLGSALFFMCTTSLVFDLFRREKRGGAVSTLQSLETVGSFVAAPVGALIAEMAGYNIVFYITTGLYFVAFLTGFFSRGIKEADEKAIRRHKKISLRESVKALKSWGLIGVSFINFSRMLILAGGVSTVFPLFFHYSHLGFSEVLIGVILGTRTGTWIIGALVSGHLSDRFGRKPFIVFGLLLDGICLFSYTLISGFFEGIIVAVFHGIGTGLTYSALVVLLSELVPSAVRSGALGVYRTFMDVGGFVGPLIFMTLYTTVSIQAPFWFGSGLSFFCIGIILIIRKKKS